MRLLERLSRCPPHAAAAGFLALFAVQAGAAAHLDSPTVDEYIHLHAGFDAVRDGDFRYNPEHPPLARMWAAAPGHFLDVKESGPMGVPMFVLGDIDLPEETPPAWVRPHHLLRVARWSNIVLALLLGLVIYRWAFELWGAPGAVVSAFLFALSPTLLAHGHFVTTDIGAGLGFALTLYLFWRFCERPTPGRCALVGLGLGLALLMKYSTLLLLPILGVLGLWKLWRVGLTRQAVGRAALSAAVILLISWTVLWAGYRFRASAGPQGKRMDWTEFKPAVTATVMRKLVFLPEAYRYGIADVSERAKRTMYLNGRTYDDGHPLYFPEAFLLKTPPALLALLAWLTWAWWRDPKGRSGAAPFLAVPVAVYAAAAIAFPLNIGHRHLLPLYPLFFVGAGAALALAAAPRARNVFIALLAAFAVSSLSACPRHLAYFNLFAGGTANGWRFLADSNIDWGQDLDRLRLKMHELQLPSVHLAYFGPADPMAHGIRFKRVTTWGNPKHGIVELPKKGDVLAISVNILAGICAWWPEKVDTTGLPPFNEWRDGILELEPFDKAGDSIFLYRMP